MLWLYTFEYNATLGQLLADEEGVAGAGAHGMPASIEQFLVAFAIRANHALFWLAWALCPALMVAYHAIRCADISAIVSAYVVCVCLAKQASELHCIAASTYAGSLTTQDKFASWVRLHMRCSIL